MLAGSSGFDPELREAIRTLLLPVHSRHEAELLAAASAALQAAGVPPDDCAERIRLELEAWRDSGCASELLAGVVSAALRAGDPDWGELMATKYLAAQSGLRERSLMSFEQASAFMSHLRLMLHLGRDEEMTAAQISRLLSRRDQRTDFYWKDVRWVLSQFGVKHSLDLNAVQATYQRDVELEEVVFADADTRVAAATAAMAATGLGFAEELEGYLRDLTEPAPVFFPFLQIMHFLCIIAEFFDHELAALYEFAPRGRVAGWLFSQYFDLVPTGNPVLNNAKAVDRLDMAWARGREDNKRQARALARIVSGLDDMSHASRQEVAAWLRRWILRVIRLARPPQNAVAERPTVSEVEAVVRAVGVGETATAGVIEQRVVDAVSSLRHPRSNGWRARGLADPVNATNLSSRKLGDCDYQHVDSRRVVAYEAHAGVLSATYLDGHMRTLRRVLPLRAEEWSSVADLEEWRVHVVFVGIGFAIEPPPPSVVEGVEVSVAFETLSDFGASALTRPRDEVLASFTRLVNAPLNERRTPNAVRARYLELVAQSQPDRAWGSRQYSDRNQR